MITASLLLPHQCSVTEITIVTTFLHWILDALKFLWCLQSIGFVGPGLSLICLNYATTPAVASIILTVALSLSSFSQAGYFLNMQVKIIFSQKKIWFISVPVLEYITYPKFLTKSLNWWLKLYDLFNHQFKLMTKTQNMSYTLTVSTSLTWFAS